MLETLVKKITCRLFTNNKRKDKFLRFLFRSLDRDPLTFAYNNIGILNYQNDIISGERNLIHNILPEYFSKKETNILFDVGANSGSYSQNLAQAFPNSTIYSFEPNKNSYKKLKHNIANYRQIKCFQIGFGNEKVTKTLYTYSDELDSEHASIYKDVFKDIHTTNKLKSILIELICLDDFCRDHNINFIDFLKIDTEGNEIEVLKGGQNMIKEGKIKIIQFEFNEMNIISRVFLKDFYNLLSEYKIYRLMENHIDPIINYNSVNEIFKFQNLLAIHKNV
ncbi:FkbM family methyltransferase [Christiangramia forsetii]|uniref:FkbM family methyltransferase n=2 Tax=Christiangramia forsetii TaxID=411153 RepID=A0LYT5_CHRFK|nr:FkbM family methyltransferase [Christiangramia forsetii]GGG33431.1 methyltransferase FkbM [Christiangramia forsetii]CAL65530.1 FkbM family methyltransferase [Christiangramia forsetii KT0803]